MKHLNFNQIMQERILNARRRKYMRAAYRIAEAHVLFFTLLFFLFFSAVVFTSSVLLSMVI